MSVTAFVLQHVGWLKPIVLLLLLPSLALAQRLWPRRGDASPRRWRVNVSLAAVSAVALAALPMLGIGVAATWAQGHDYGLLRVLGLPWAVNWLLTWVLLDFAIYWQHRAFHAAPLLWRAHRVHHLADGFETSLGLRFHPLEIVPSAAFKASVVIALGAPPAAAISYEILLLAMSLLTHADIALPPRLDALLRWVVVTPDWHRVHHSPHRTETDSNFGNWLSVWDRLFGTHVAQPRDGHADMRPGLSDYADPRWQSLSAALRNPFTTASDPEPPYA